MEQLAPMIEGFLESVQRMYEALQPVADFLGTVLGAALSLVVALFGGIVQAVTFVIDSLAGFVEFLTGLPQSVSQFVTDVGNFFSQLPGLVKLWFDQAISAAVSWAASMVSQAVTAGSEFVNAVVSFVSSLPGKVAGFAGQMASAAGDMIRGMVSGVQGAAGAVWDAIVNVCSGALDAVKSFFGIASPSKVMKATFKWVPLGAAEGIDAAAGSVAKSMAAMGVGAVSAAAKVADAIAAPFSNMAISAPRMSSAGYGASNGTVLTAKKNGALTKDDVFDAMDKALSRFEGRPIIVIVKADDREIARVVRKYA